jgi:hypothetical protein
VVLSLPLNREGEASRVKTCFLFPGQGAQYPGMAKDLWDASDKVKELFRQASEASGMDLARLLFEGSEEELKVTDKTQVAVTLANVAASLACRERGLEPAGFAGFSLGEYTALYEAGVIRLEDLFPIVKTRGLLMEKASRGADTAAGRAGMAAVIGLGYVEAVKALESLQGEKVCLANYSSPTQVVLSGTAEGLAKAEAAFDAAGARRFIVLKVSGPFHSPLLRKPAGVEGLWGCLSPSSGRCTQPASGIGSGRSPGAVRARWFPRCVGGRGTSPWPTASSAAWRWPGACWAGVEGLHQEVPAFRRARRKKSPGSHKEREPCC